MKDKLKFALKPLYKDMLKSVGQSDIRVFCVQWGKDFPQEERTGILFVGKATNGWVSKSSDVDDLFGDSPERIFNRHNQMEWIEKNQNNNKKGKDDYNANSSAFLRLMRSVSSSYYSKPRGWSSMVAWSNLYKVAPAKGNPSEKMKKAQVEHYKKILKAEIEILSPKYVIFFTSGWADEFIRFLNGNEPTKSFEKETWGKDYEIKAYNIGGVICINTQHPQGKKEEEHLSAIKRIIDKIEKS